MAFIALRSSDGFAQLLFSLYFATQSGEHAGMSNHVRGGVVELHCPRRPAQGQRHIFFVGAMNESLVREAAERGATLYLTGQYRLSTQKTVQETSIGVIAHNFKQLYLINFCKEHLIFVIFKDFCI